MDVRSFDLYGFEPNLLYKNNKKFKTYPGLCLTAVTACIFTFMLVISAQDIFNRARPLFIQSVLIDPDPEEFTFNKDNFLFVGALEYENAQFYIDESVYSLKMNKNIHTKGENGIYSVQTVNIPVKRCSEVDSELVNSTFSHLPLDYLYCSAEDQEFSIKGIFGSDIYISLDVTIARCNPEERECKSDEEIDEIIRAGYFGFFFSDSTFEPSNVHEPFKKYPANYFTTITDTSSKFLSLVIDKNVSKTDIGMVTETIEEVEDFSVNSFTETVVGKTGREILTVNFYFSNKTLEFSRSYVKIQKALAEVGAVTNVFINIFGFLARFTAEKQLYLAIQEDFCHFALNEEKIRNIPFKDSSTNTIRAVRKITTTTKIKHKSFFLLRTCCFCFGSKNLGKVKRKVNLIRNRLNLWSLLEVQADVKLLTSLLLEDYQVKFFHKPELKDKARKMLLEEKKTNTNVDVQRVASSSNHIDKRMTELAS